jgi:hypothetical protein
MDSRRALLTELTLTTKSNGTATEQRLMSADPTTEAHR